MRPLVIVATLLLVVIAYAEDIKVEVTVSSGIATLVKDKLTMHHPTTCQLTFSWQNKGVLAEPTWQLDATSSVRLRFVRIALGESCQLILELQTTGAGMGTLTIEADGQTRTIDIATEDDDEIERTVCVGSVGSYDMWLQHVSLLQPQRSSRTIGRLNDSSR